MPNCSSLRQQLWLVRRVVRRGLGDTFWMRWDVHKRRTFLWSSKRWRNLSYRLKSSVDGSNQTPEGPKSVHGGRSRRCMLVRGAPATIGFGQISLHGVSAYEPPA